MRARFVALAALAVAVAVASVAAAATAAPTASRTFTLKLTGKSETPVGDKSGKGTATITVKSTGSVCWKFKLTKIDGAAAAAHIHKGKAGTAGPVVVPFGTAYKAKGCTKTKRSVAKAIIAHPRSYYVNVHNAKHLAGALRSQL
jgi:CHRD domain-containing protein